jgi:hypothetical protein
MTTETIYAYNDLNHQTVMVSENNLNMVGEWSSSGTYFAESKDTVDYGSALYLALVDNIGVNPTQAPRKGQQAKWSPLAVISQGTHFDDHTADQAYALALQAIGSANEALVIAVEGTNAASSAQNLAVAANDLAYVALQTAWSGTNGVAEAIQIAVNGTNSAAAAIASVASSAAAAQASADTAQITASAAQSSANAAQSSADTAENTALSAQSSSNGARTVADAAFSIAVAGTNAAATAQSTANSANAQASAALQTAWSGTSAANSALHANCGFSFVVDGGGAPILTGFKGYVSMPFNMWVTGWTLVADQSGTLIVDVLKSNGYAGFPTAPSIADSDKPTLNNTQQNRNVAITSWTQQQFNQGDLVGFTVNTAGTVQIATVAINGTRN